MAKRSDAGRARKKKGGGSARLAKELDAYRAAMRWRRAVNKELGLVELTLTQWLILEAAQELIAERENAVSQVAIAERADIDQMTVSQVLRTLEEKGLADRGPDESGPAYRIWLTEHGTDAAAEGRARVEAMGGKAPGRAGSRSRRTPKRRSRSTSA